MLRKGLCLLLTAALCLAAGCTTDRAALQAEAEQALLAQQEEALRQEEEERRAAVAEQRRQAGDVLYAEMEGASSPMPTSPVLPAESLGPVSGMGQPGSPTLNVFLCKIIKKKE